MYERIARIVDVMQREEFKHLQGKSIDYPVCGLPKVIAKDRTGAYEDLTIKPASGYTTKYVFSWRGDVYLAFTETTKENVPLNGRIGQINASHIFQDVEQAYDSPVTAGKGIILNEFLLKTFMERFKQNIEDFDQMSFWLCDVYDESFAKKYGAHHCVRRVRGVKCVDNGYIRDYPLEITERGEYYGAFPLLILAKVPFDTMVYIDGEEGKPLRIVPEGCARRRIKTEEYVWELGEPEEENLK